MDPSPRPLTLFLVETTQSCIQNCRGDESCFSGCIQDHWPTSVSYTSAPSLTASPTDATRAATSLSIHPSASVSGSVAQSATATPNSAQRAMLSDNHFKQNSLAIAILAVVAAVFL